MYIAVEMYVSVHNYPKREPEINVNDTGYFQRTKSEAWELVKDVFSKEHTIILDGEGKVYPVE